MSGLHVHAGAAHGPAAGASAAARSAPRLLAVLVLTSLYLLAEVVGGLLTGSLALLADAGHMLTDVLGLGMALFAIRFAQRPATPARTYGFYRAEILAAAANSIVLFGIAGYILFEAWHRFNEPPEIKSLPMLAVAIGGLVVNLVGVRLLHGGADESLNLRAARLEVLADLLGSVGVVLAALVIQFTGWWPADPLVSVVIGAFILPRTWQLLRSALDVLLESTPAHIDVTEVEGVMRAVPGVGSVHDLHVWAITSGFVAMSGHVQASGRPSSDVLHDLRVALHDRFQIEHVTLQVEQPDHADDGACCTLDPRCLIVGPINPAARPRG
jgi:cobalt-zinc-cadmium efflux system protein